MKYYDKLLSDISDVDLMTDFLEEIDTTCRFCAFQEEEECELKCKEGIKKFLETEIKEEGS